MSTEYRDRHDRPLRDQYRDPDDHPTRIVVGPTPWSGGQEL